MTSAESHVVDLARDLALSDEPPSYPHGDGACRDARRETWAERVTGASAEWRHYCAAFDSNLEYFLSMSEREFDEYRDVTSG